MSAGDGHGHYVPVACSFHESLEYAVLRRQPLRLRYHSGDGAGDEVVLPTDVRTRDGAEWLYYRCVDGREAHMRLDRLISAEAADLPG